MGAKESRFLEEVAEQPRALLDLVEFYSGKGSALLQRWAALAQREGRVVFSGMGTSEFTPDIIRVALAVEGVDASTLDAGEWLHYPRPAFGLTVLISQSGESIETRLLAPRIARKGQLVAITNTADSSLARAAHLVLPLCAGYEKMISTKTYVNTLALLHLMAQVMKGDAVLGRALRALRAVAARMAGADAAGIRRAGRLLGKARAIQFVSRGPALTAARQAGLTFMEGTRLPTTTFSGGAFRHGPFELVDRDFFCVFFIAKGPAAKLLSSMAAEVAAKKGHVVVVTDTSLRLSGRNACVLRVPSLGEDLFALAAATTQELLLHAVAGERGVVAGDFRYGQKVTARE